MALLLPAGGALWSVSGTAPSADADARDWLYKLEKLMKNLLINMYFVWKSDRADRYSWWYWTRRLLINKRALKGWCLIHNSCFAQAHLFRGWFFLLLLTLLILHLLINDYGCMKINPSIVLDWLGSLELFNPHYYNITILDESTTADEMEKFVSSSTKEAISWIV